MMRLTYDPELVEEAVLLSEPAASRADAGAFRRERDRVYAMTDPDRRDAAFQALHRRWFARLRLHEIVGQVVADQRDVADRVAEGRVLRAVTRREEGADLVDQLVPGGVDRRPILVLRLRPRTLLEPEALRALVRHELVHVADMLDPAFGYQRWLPHSDDGPSGDNIVRDRYRVLWDVTIDGRLARAGMGSVRMRTARWQEFTATFPMLGDRSGAAFDDWFDRIWPTHAALAAFAQAPNGADGTNPANSGRCPLCRFPVASRDPRPGRLSAATQVAIRINHPAWRVEQGLYSQCLDLYEARHEEAVDDGDSYQRLSDSTGHVARRMT